MCFCSLWVHPLTCVSSLRGFESTNEKDKQITRSRREIFEENISLDQHLMRLRTNCATVCHSNDDSVRNRSDDPLTPTSSIICHLLFNSTNGFRIHFYQKYPFIATDPLVSQFCEHGLLSFGGLSHNSRDKVLRLQQQCIHFPLEDKSSL